MVNSNDETTPDRGGGDDIRCGACGKAMTRRNSTLMPEMFLCDDCARREVPEHVRELDDRDNGERFLTRRGFADSRVYSAAELGPLLDEYARQTAAPQFSLTRAELARFEAWDAEHHPKCKYFDDGTSPVSPVGAIGGRLSFCFTPTGIGTAVTVECACGEKVNVTDYGSW